MSNSPEKFFNDQNDVAGQRKKVNVQDYPSTIELDNALKDVNYPADKKSIINSIDHNKTDNKIIECLEKIEDKQDSNSSEVVSATGIVNS